MNVNRAEAIEAPSAPAYALSAKVLAQEGTMTKPYGDHPGSAQEGLPIARNDPSVGQFVHCIMPRTLIQSIGLLNVPIARIDARLMENRQR